MAPNRFSSIHSQLNFNIKVGDYNLVVFIIDLGVVNEFSWSSLLFLSAGLDDVSWILKHI